MSHAIVAAPPAVARHRTESFESYFLREYRAVLAIACVVSSRRDLAETLAAQAVFSVRRPFAAIRRPEDRVRSALVNTARSLESAFGGATRLRLRRHRVERRLGPPIPSDLWLWSAIRELPVDVRAALAFHHLEDLPVSRIAAILHCSDARAEGHLHDGLEALAAMEDTP